LRSGFRRGDLEVRSRFPGVQVGVSASPVAWVAQDVLPQLGIDPAVCPHPFERLGFLYFKQAVA